MKMTETQVPESIPPNEKWARLAEFTFITSVFEAATARMPLQPK